MVHPKTYAAAPLRDDVLGTVARLAPVAGSLGCGAALEAVAHTATAGSDASFLRESHRRSGSAEGMVDAALQRFRSWAKRSAHHGPRLGPPGLARGLPSA